MLRQTTRTTFHRRPARGSYDRATAHAILDEALFCSVGFVVDGQPFVIPMAFARRGDQIVLHGARASRLLGVAERGEPLCVTATIVDGLVLARSAMHHSMNYRSVAIFGRAVDIVERDDKIAALAAVIDHAVPGRSGETRSPDDRELAATRVVAVPIEEASVKIRAGGPIDDDADLALPFWAGQLPIRLLRLDPVPDQVHPPSGTPPSNLFHSSPSSSSF